MRNKTTCLILTFFLSFMSLEAYAFTKARGKIIFKPSKTVSQQLTQLFDLGELDLAKILFNGKRSRKKKNTIKITGAFNGDRLIEVEARKHSAKLNVAEADIRLICSELNFAEVKSRKDVVESSNNSLTISFIDPQTEEEFTDTLPLGPMVIETKIVRNVCSFKISAGIFKDFSEFEDLLDDDNEPARIIKALTGAETELLEELGSVTVTSSLALVGVADFDGVLVPEVASNPLNPLNGPQLKVIFNINNDDNFINILNQLGANNGDEIPLFFTQSQIGSVNEPNDASVFVYRDSSNLITVLLYTLGDLLNFFGGDEGKGETVLRGDSATITSSDNLFALVTLGQQDQNGNFLGTTQEQFLLPNNSANNVAVVISDTATVSDILVEGDTGAPNVFGNTGSFVISGSISNPVAVVQP